MLDPGRTSWDADADADAVQPSPSDAVRFLAALDAGGQFTFQCFDDNAIRNDKSLAQIRHGTLKQHWHELLQLNERGAGVFVTINATNLKGRKATNVIKVRAQFVDLDGAPLDPVATCGTPPHIIVESLPGRWHAYWLVSDVPLDQFEPMQLALAGRFNGDPSVHDLPRVLRLPGFIHRKAAPFLSLLQDVDQREPYTFEQMRAAFPPKPKPERLPEPEPTGSTDRRRGEAWARKALDVSAHELANAAVNTRHDTLLKKANRMGTMIARGWIDTHEVRRALFAAAEANGQIKKYGAGKFNDTFRDGTAHGILMPHPDLPDSEPLRHANANAAATGSKADKSETGAALSARDLNTMRFAPIKYVVPGIIVEGLTLLAGKPKMGKSWLLLHAAIAVARSGYTLGDIKCTEGDVLYCALEDNLRRLQSRMTKLLGTQEWPARLSFRCEMPRLAEGGLNLIKEWITAANHPRLVIIDTLAMVRTPKRRDESSYDADYSAVKELRDLANKHGIAIVLVHHLRKAESDDAFDTVSGTLGLTGAPDTILVLRRDSSGNIVLHGRGRDLIEIEKAMTFNLNTCIWTIAGDVREVCASNERKAILAAMHKIDLPASPADIAAAANMKDPNVKRLLSKMIDDGTITKCGYGKYNLAVAPEHA